ncbi:MAG TPA: BNR-4 repeat-containing protein [Thermoleophilaceae bacterium]|nr:BNR-4 repeat-containing protein [Thermoleophilaceae bacterium]
MRGALVVLACVLASAGTASAAQPPLGGGAWSWFGDPRAVTHAHEGSYKTFVGWVDLEGDIKVSSYDHNTGERVTAVLQARLNQDDHANPSIHVRPDGHLVVFYSAHVGPAMHYRVSSEPGSVRSWEAPKTVPVNTPGNFGYTYPNPIRLPQENKTYLFWRGGNYNPTFSTQMDGSSEWSEAKNLIHLPNERPYVKYASDGQDTIHVAYTNAHPNEFGDVNIYYARVRDGMIERANAEPIEPLADAPITPAAGDEVFDEAEQAWVHDVAADSDGNPVIVFASFPTPADHRYWYARWTPTTGWDVQRIETAEVSSMGGSFREDGGSPYYSGGLTLDHEDPSIVYLSRQVGEGAWQVETWTTPDGGANWNSAQVSLAGDRNVRPVSPRGMPNPFEDDLSVIWMRGSYPTYEDYRTSIIATAGEENAPPVADAEPSVRSGPAPVEVRFTSLSEDPDGQIASWQWDFDDEGATAEGAEVTHDYTEPGRYFPTLTVTSADDPATLPDESGTSIFVEEIVVGLPAAPVTHTGGSDGGTAHGAVDPENRPTEWYFEYGPTIDYGARTPSGHLPRGDALEQVAVALPGLTPGRLYHYRLVASNDMGTTQGEDRVIVAGSAPGSDAYRAAVLGTDGLVAYWRLGDLSASTATEEVSAPGGPEPPGGTPYAAATFGGRFVLGQVGVLGPLGDTAASFDGASGSVTAPGPVLETSGTMEGWFRWRAGTTVMRDGTDRSRGWLLAFDVEGTLRYRVGGQGYDTLRPIGEVRNGQWHHLVATKDGAQARLYVDGVQVHQGGGADNDEAIPTWHVMRNGPRPVYSEGEADEIALYGRALTATEVQQHYNLARSLAAAPLPAETPDPVVDPPAAGTGPGGGVLTPGGGATTGDAGAGSVGGTTGGGGTGSGGGGSGPGGPATRPPGKAYVRGARLIVRGAPGGPNKLSARRRGRAWRIADAAARLRPGRGCKRLNARAVSCRATGVRTIELHGGAGADTLTVTGRTRALLVGGPGADRLTGGPLARFRSGPGADRHFRRP